MVSDLVKVITILTLISSSKIYGEASQVEVDFELDHETFYQGEVLPVNMVISNSESEDYVINVHLWNETNCEFTVYKDGIEIPKLYKQRLIGGASLGRRVIAESTTKIPLFPALLVDFSDPGDYRIKVHLHNAYLAPLGHMGSAEAYRSITEDLSETFEFSILNSDIETSLRENEEWIKDLKSNSDNLSNDALRGLVGTRMDQVADIIYSESLSNRDLNNGLYALARMNTKHSVELLGRAILEGAPWAVEEALHQIGNFYILALEELVKRQLESNDFRIREKAREALERLDYAKVNNIADERFNSPVFSESGNIIRRTHGIEAIGNVNRPLEPISKVRDNNDIEGEESRGWLSIAVLVGLFFILLFGVGMVIRRNN